MKAQTKAICEAARSLNHRYRMNGKIPIESILKASTEIRINTNNILESKLKGSGKWFKEEKWSKKHTLLVIKLIMGCNVQHRDYSQM